MKEREDGPKKGDKPPAVLPPVPTHAFFDGKYININSTTATGEPEWCGFWNRYGYGEIDSKPLASTRQTNRIPAPPIALRPDAGLSQKSRKEFAMGHVY